MILDNFKIFKKSPLFKIWLKSKFFFLEIYFMRCSKISHFKKSGSPLTNLWSIFNKILQNYLKSSSLKIIFFEFSDIPKNIYYDKKSCFGQFGDLEKVSTFFKIRKLQLFSLQICSVRCDEIFHDLISRSPLTNSPSNLNKFFQNLS